MADVGGWTGSFDAVGGEIFEASTAGVGGLSMGGNPDKSADGGIRF